MDKKVIILGILGIIIIVGLVLVFTDVIPLKDLGVTTVSAPASAQKGQNISVDNTVMNRGLLDSGSFRVYFYLTPNQSTSNKTFLGTRYIKSLAGRATDQENTMLTIPNNVTAGNYYIMAIVDMPDNVKEFNEKNNKQFSTTLIKIT